MQQAVCNELDIAPAWSGHGGGWMQTSKPCIHLSSQCSRFEARLQTRPEQNEILISPMLGKHDMLWKGGRQGLGRLPHGPGATHVSGSSSKQHSQPCKAFSRAYTAVSPSRRLQSSAGPLETSRVLSALGRLLTQHILSHAALGWAACPWLARLSIPCPGPIGFISLAGLHTQSQAAFPSSTLAGCLHSLRSGRRCKGKDKQTSVVL